MSGVKNLPPKLTIHMAKRAATRRSLLVSASWFADPPLASLVPPRRFSWRWLPKAVELFVALVAVVIAVWSNVRSNAVQERLAEHQSKQQSIADANAHSDSLLALLGTNLGSIDLDTSSGRAAYRICLRAALALNEQKLRSDTNYLDLLPRYEASALADSLQNVDPDLLRLALDYGPKPLARKLGEGGTFYVSVGTFSHPVPEQIELAKRGIRLALRSHANLRELGVMTLKRANRPDSFVLVVGREQLSLDADILVTELRKLLPGIVAYKIASAEVAKM